jgi:regulatory protein
MDIDNIPIQQDNPQRIIRHKITRLLAKREHSYAELLQKLEVLALPEHDVTHVLQQFVAKDIQSDARFTFHFVRNCMAKGQGLSRIKQALYPHQIDESMLNEALAELQPDWFALAYQVKCKKYAVYPETDWTLKQKQMRFLQYRGFNQEQISHAVDYQENF